MRLQRSGLALLFCALVGVSSGAAAACGTAATNLEIRQSDVPGIPRHDQSIGKSTITLRAQLGGKLLFSARHEGRWFCLGFNQKRRQYVIGGIFERGVWLPLASIVYLKEDGASLKPSAFNRGEYLAMTAQVDASGRYIVFVGGQHAADTLYILDTEKDEIRKLGAAPAPSPQAAETVAICEGEYFAWGACGADGYVALEAGILRFTPGGILEVSYGHQDRATARDRQRYIRRFRLSH